jgi:hypothetical protein
MGSIVVSEGNHLYKFNDILTTFVIYANGAKVYVTWEEFSRWKTPKSKLVSDMWRGISNYC